ncbi:MAG: DUF1413 domain-containing protein [Bacilli bacterium]
MKCMYDDIKEKIYDKLNSLEEGKEFSIKDLVDEEIWNKISDEDKDSIGKLFYADIYYFKGIKLNNNYVGKDYGTKNVYIKVNSDHFPPQKNTKFYLKIIGGIAGVFLCFLIFIIIIVASYDNNTSEEDNKQLDGMQGTWYQYDNYGVKETDTYIIANGNGEYRSVARGYIFNDIGDGSYYTIQNNQVTFYNSDGSEWISCNIHSSNRMDCFYGSGIVNAFAR